MSHRRGSVPGPTTQGGERPVGSALPGEHAAALQASPPAPLGYDEGASESLQTTMTVTPPIAASEQWYDPSEGESATGTNMPPRGGSRSLPDEDC
jgi:hypothetical protein